MITHLVIQIQSFFFAEAVLTLQSFSLSVELTAMVTLSRLSKGKRFCQNISSCRQLIQLLQRLDEARKTGLKIQKK